VPRRLLREPLVLATLALLAAIALGFVLRSSTGAPLVRTARLAKTRARLADGVCVFSTDVQLHSLWGQWAFARNQVEIRAGVMSLMKTKSRYMVDTPTARQALAWQVVRLVNNLTSTHTAERVAFPDFEVF